MTELCGTILVTGGMGFIGSNFVRHLLTAHPAARVVNLDKLTYAGNPRNLADLEADPRHVFVRADVCDEKAVTEILEVHWAQAIVHFAAESHVDRSILQADDFIRTNVQGTRVLLEAARRARIARFLHISTDEVYGSLGKSGAFTEDSPLLPNSPYAASKAGADVLARAYHVTYGLPVIITRTCNNYGPYQFPEKFIPLMIVNALREEPLPIYGDGLYVREWLHVEDHCRALARILASGQPGQVYNIGSGEEQMNLDVARQILALTGRSEALLRHVKDRLGHDRRYALDWIKIRRELDWAPTIPFTEGLRQTVEWYRAHPAWWLEILSGEYRAYYQRQYGEGTQGGHPEGDPGGARMSGPEDLALRGGRPVRERMLPYGRHDVDEADIQAVVEVLRGDWLTNGPTVRQFEKAFAEVVGAQHAVAFSSGTAALHAAAHVAGIQPGDEVITSPLTFLASANCLLYCGATPVFADIDPATLNLDPKSVEAKLSPRTKAILPIHFAGLPCALDRIHAVARSRNLTVIEDAAHALGAAIGGRPVGGLSELTTFSFHPVKHITTGEGGMVTTNEEALADRLRRFRNHGIGVEVRDRQGTTPGAWRQDMVDFGFNYRLSDLHSGLGLSQLRRLHTSLKRREEIAAQYHAAFAVMPEVRVAPTRPGTRHAWHIYPLRLITDRLREDRETIFQALRAENIGVTVHYLPVHLHPYYQERFGTRRGMCPAAEAAADQLLTLPLFPRMTDGDAADVIAAVGKVIQWARR